MTKEEIAQDILQIIPAIMRVVAADLRTRSYQLLPAQLGVLAHLSQRSCNISELAEMQSVSLPTMSGTTSKLVSAGLVQRTRSEEDRRITLLELTTEGKELLDEIASHAVQRMSENLQSLSTQELELVASGLKILGKVFAPFEIVNIKNNTEE